MRTLHHYLRDDNRGGQLVKGVGCGIVGVFAADFLAPALESGWPLFRLLALFSDLVTLSALAANRLAVLPSRTSAA